MRVRCPRVLGAAVLIGLGWSGPAWADDLGDLKAHVNQLQGELVKLYERIGALEAQQVEDGSPPGKSDVAAYPGAILSLEGMQFGLGGEVELNYVDSSIDNSTEEAEPHLLIDKIVLEPRIIVSEHIRFDADLQFDEDSMKDDEYYFTFSGLPLESRVRLGKDDRFWKPDRLTERYPLAMKAFSQDEELGLVWQMEQYEPFIGYFSWSQGLELDEDDPNNIDSSNAYELIHDDTRSSSFNGLKQVALGLGYKGDVAGGEVEVLGFAQRGQLSRADIDFLNARLVGYRSRAQRQHRMGVNLGYTRGDFNVFSQYVDAKDGKLDRYGWYVQPSYKIRLPYHWRYANDHRLLYRHGRYDVDHTKRFADPESWDRFEHTFAVLTDVARGLTWKNEYTVNDEKTGGGTGGVNNNEYVMQLEYEF